MAEKIQVTIVAIDDKSPHLATVIALGDAHKDTLSFFPKGAFQEHAHHGEILVALEPHAGCIGYVLYDRSRKYNRITLIHLCIDPSHRGKGVARKLVERLIQNTQEYSGIGLTCRRDYQLQDMWSGLGFVAKYDEPAKTSGKLNTYWWLDHGHLNLLSTLATSQRQSKLCAVIDAKIFFDFYTNDKIDSQESKCLLADWLQPDLDLWLTDEIFNKINTVSDLEERKRLQKLAENFTCVPCQNQRLNEVFLSLKKFYTTKDIATDEADLRYQARAQASQVHLFVTRDSRLLALADELYENFKWSVISPTDLILRLEELRRNSEYQPVRLAGTSLKKTPVQRGE